MHGLWFTREALASAPMPPFTRSRVSSTAFARQMGSVVVPRHALLRDAMIFDRRLENHAVGELIDHAALDLLPRRLARRMFVGILLLQCGAGRGYVGVWQQQLAESLV